VKPPKYITTSGSVLPASDYAPFAGVGPSGLSVQFLTIGGVTPNSPTPFIGLCRDRYSGGDFAVPAVPPERAPAAVQGRETLFEFRATAGSAGAPHLPEPEPVVAYGPFFPS
jgi:hypothetical protein